MSALYFLFIIIAFNLFNTSSHAAQELTQANINTKRLAATQNAATKQDIFNLLDFLKSAPSATTENNKSTAITAVRECLNDQVLPTNLELIDEKAMDHIKNRLMKEEINLFRRFGVQGFKKLNKNFMPMKHTEVQLATQTRDLSAMVGKVEARDGTGTGTLVAIPVPNGMLTPKLGQQYVWAILTCGHMLGDIGCDKHDGNDDNLTFKLKQVGGAIVDLPIKSIKVFKRVGESLIITDVGHLPPNPENSVGFPDHVRALPRYDSNGDLAICFFDDQFVLGNPINQTVNDYLNDQFPINIAPNFAVDTLTFSIQKGMAAVKHYTLRFIDNDQHPLIAEINARPKTEMFALGYAAFETEDLPTLSGSRNVNRNHIYPHVINETANQSTAYNFFHDIPTYSGMSGGPIFHVDNVTHTVTIFGVVLGHNDVDGANIPNVAEKSRCEATFLKQNMLQ